MIVGQFPTNRLDFDLYELTILQNNSETIRHVDVDIDIYSELYINELSGRYQT